MREKVQPHWDPLEVVYEEERWDVLSSLRERARQVHDALGTPCHAYGSVARGDVRHKSDVDLIILHQIPSFKIEVALDRAGLAPVSREIMKASPNSVPKGHIHLDETTTISFFLGPPTLSEEEFYRFGGLVEADAGTDIRVPGVDKRLLFIEPTGDGHVEWGISGREPRVAKLLDIGVDTVNERVRVLSRRDRVGRTGVYLRRTLGEEEGFEEMLKRIMDRDNVTRRQVRRKDR